MGGEKVRLYVTGQFLGYKRCAFGGRRRPPALHAGSMQPERAMACTVSPQITTAACTQHLWAPADARPPLLTCGQGRRRRPGAQLCVGAA